MNEEGLDRVLLALRGLPTVMEWLTEIITVPKQPREPTVAKRKMEFLSKFRKLDPPNFHGNTSHDVCDAERWIKKVKKLFETVGMPEEFKVCMASSLLFDEADHWWDIIKARHNVGTMTWQVFEEHFYAQYFRQVVRESKLQEFINLSQRDMTVSQYEIKFSELSRFG
ncbi:uncharacterized protein LOC132281596 [Cornus florida]|uniref:uncharacterized protein LOC132281596 n=1 Tax=Cornus florida TaxID=4283 RepID=UPI002899B1B8|nr:uncharacterized protein LOC132281596 [Cornus florida]